MSEKKATFEQQIARLEEIVAALEKGDAQLADSLALFEEGTKLIASCSKQLDQAEQQVVKLMKGTDGAPVELPFEDKEDGGTWKSVNLTFDTVIIAGRWRNI